MIGTGVHIRGIVPSLDGVFDPADLAENLLFWGGTSVTTDGAAQFTAANSEYLSSASTDFNKGNESFSFGGWVYFDALGSYQSIMSKWGNSSNKRSYVLAKFASNEFRILVSDDGGVGGITNLDSGTSATISTWHFVVGVYDADADLLKISVDGAAFVTTAQSTGVYNDGSPVDLFLGKDESGGALGGREDSMFFYNKALTIAEVGALRNAGAGLVYSDLTAAQKVSLVSWWGLDELSGTRVDSQGTNDLTDNNTVTSANGIVSGAATDENDVITTWTDASVTGNNATQTTATKKPVLNLTEVNSIDALEFDGVDDYLDLGSTFQTMFRSDYAVSMVVYIADGQPATDGVIFGCQKSDNTDFVNPQLLSTGILLFGMREGANSPQARTNVAFANGVIGWKLLTFYADFTNSQLNIRVDKVNQALNPSFDGDTTGYTPSNLSLDQNCFLSAYNDNTGPGSYSALKFPKEGVLFYSTTNGIADVDNVENYLNTKFNLGL